MIRTCNLCHVTCKTGNSVNKVINQKTRSKTMNSKPRDIGVTKRVAVSIMTLWFTQAAQADTNPADDLATIMDWWNGDYSNDLQVGELEAAGKPIWRADDSGEGGHIEVESHYRTVSLPAFGENVIYVEELKHKNPSEIFRQRIYTLSIDDDLNQVRVKLWNFKDKEKYVGAWNNLSMIQNLSPDEMSPLPDNCDLFVVRDDDKYHMPMNGRDCAFGDLYFNYQVLLGPDSFSFRDKIVRLSDDVVTTAAGGFTYHVLDRVD